MNLQILNADYLNTQHAKDISYLLNCYSLDEMGNNEELPLDIRNNIAKELSKLSNSFTFLAYIDNQAVGIITCFVNFSTFKCKPLISIHDIFVHKDYRNKGISQKLLQEVQIEAKKRDCCKITLEVLQGNNIAQNSYKKFGFNPYELDPKMGQALFWEKTII